MGLPSEPELQRRDGTSFTGSVSAARDHTDLPDALQDPILKGWDGWTSYFGTYPTLHETIFVKTNRGALEKDLLVYTWMEKEQAKGVWGGY